MHRMRVLTPKLTLTNCVRCKANEKVSGKHCKIRKQERDFVLR